MSDFSEAKTILELEEKEKQGEEEEQVDEELKKVEEKAKEMEKTISHSQARQC